MPLPDGDLHPPVASARLQAVEVYDPKGQAVDPFAHADADPLIGALKELARLQTLQLEQLELILAKL